ncbi:poly(A)-specific ribonuclease [Physocladia obscura]|uniref:Poly(A)-specific ribonuclease n=1 Tax=Physocladia obscura TaxID=109957 RepID=A0AAD5T489_9FUNG|nr:poly(A)-specific ribonuclease [Physocladia obscura]
MPEIKFNGRSLAIIPFANEKLLGYYYGNARIRIYYSQIKGIRIRPVEAFAWAKGLPTGPQMQTISTRTTVNHISRRKGDLHLYRNPESVVGLDLAGHSKYERIFFEVHNIPPARIAERIRRAVGRPLNILYFKRDQWFAPLRFLSSSRTINFNVSTIFVTGISISTNCARIRNTWGSIRIPAFARISCNSLSTSRRGLARDRDLDLDLESNFSIVISHQRKTQMAQLSRAGVVDTQTQITASHFDVLEGLLWIGTEQGRVLSLVPPTLALHTCGICVPGRLSVRQLLTADAGLLVLADYVLSLRRRHSLSPLWTVAPSHSDSFLSMVISDSDVLVSTTRGSLLCIGLKSGTVLRNFVPGDSFVSLNPGYVLMKRVSPTANSKILACASATGVLQFRDLRAPYAKVVARIEAHTAVICDFDISSSSILATCGYSLIGEMMVPETVVKLWDLRVSSSPKTLPSVLCEAESPPSFVRFGVAPGVLNFLGCQNSGKLISWIPAGVSNDTGGVSSPEYAMKTDLDGYMTGIEYCSTGDYLAVTSSAGTVSVWKSSDRIGDDDDDLRVNAYQRESDVANSLSEIIHVGDDTPLSTVGMPYYATTLLSATWPSSALVCEIGQPSPRIPKEILAAVKMSDFVGYAKTPGNLGFRRNQSARSVLNEAANRIAAALEEEEPKFRSEQEREGLKGKRSKGKTPFARDSPILESSTAFAIIPKPYRQVEIKYSKFGVEDFDFGFFNKTPYSGLETHIKNSYCNSILQLFFHTKPFREIAKAHISSNISGNNSPESNASNKLPQAMLQQTADVVCTKQSCLLCELGFLFRMLEDAKGANCQATNFLYVFGKLPQAAALGLFEQDAAVLAAAGSIGTTNASCSVMMHGFHRFILETVSSESGGADLKIAKNAVNGCSTLVQQAMGIPMVNSNICQGCEKEDMRETVQFVVDMGLKLQDDKDTSDIISFATLLENSLHKDAAAKAWCTGCNKYQLLTQSKQIKALPNLFSVNLKSVLPLLEDGEIHLDNMATWLPFRIALILEGAKLQVVELDKGDVFNIDEYGSADVAVYDLKGVISEIKVEDDPTKSHLVAHIFVDIESEWILFNDFFVQSIPSSDVRQFTKWKSPTVLQYSRVDLDSLIDYNRLTEKKSLENLLLRNPLINRRKDLTINYTPLKKNEMPLKAGVMVAIDAEFVALQKEETELHSDGSRSTIMPSKLGLARVSVLRGEDGSLFGVPFIDDYIAIQDTIVDYLTEFSGINLGDLDPSSSTRPLVPLKIAYQKLRYLVDIGCIFVGHGLKKDFRTINIIIPPAQIIDTVDIFFVKERQRKLSLRFLAWYLLKSDIQQETHDSIEDARTALLLYKKYLALKDAGTFKSVLDEVYEEGRRVNFKPVPPPTPVAGKTRTV